MVLAVAVMGTGAPFVKIGLEEFGVVTLLALRFGLACLLLIPKGGIDLKAMRETSLASIAGGGSILLAFVALDELPSSIVPVMFALIPGMTLTWEVARRRSTFTRRNITAMAVAFFGVVVLADLAASSVTAPGLGLTALAGSVLLYAIYGVASKDTQIKNPTYTDRHMTFYLSFTTLLLTSPLALWEIFSGNAVGSPGVAHLGVVFYLVVFTTVGQFVIYQKIIKEYSTVIASLYLYIQIPFSAIASALLLGEALSPSLILGTALVLIGAAGVEKASVPKPQPVPAFSKRL